MRGIGLSMMRTSTCDDSEIAVFFVYAPDSVIPSRYCLPHCLSNGMMFSAARCDGESSSGVIRYFSTIEAAYWSTVGIGKVLSVFIGRRVEGVEFAPAGEPVDTAPTPTDNVARQGNPAHRPCLPPIEATEASVGTRRRLQCPFQ